MNPTASPARRRAVLVHGLRRAAVAASMIVLVAGAAPAPAGAAPAASLRRVAAEHYDAGFLARGRAYHRFYYVLYFVQTAVVLGAAWLLAAGPLGRWNDTFLAAAGGRVWLSRVLVLSALHLGFALLRLPFSVGRYLHARAFGMRHDGWAAFGGDWLKSVGIGWVLVLAVGLTVLGLFAARPRWGWLLAGGAVSALTVLYVTLAPLVIDPLFNRFQRLDDPVLEARLLDLAREGGVPAREVLVADASRRTRAVNAYFTGFGKTRRIVLYDTLLRSFTPEETALVVAHEVGHWKHHHIQWGLLLGLGGAFLGLALGWRLLGAWVGAGRGGLTGFGAPALAIPAYAVYLSLMLLTVVPGNWVSRRMEAQADRTSIHLTGDRAGFIRSEVKLGRENLADVVPPAWIEFALYTHPANARRILMAEEHP